MGIGISLQRLVVKLKVILGDPDQCYWLKSMPNEDTAIKMMQLNMPTL